MPHAYTHSTRPHHSSLSLSLCLLNLSHVVVLTRQAVTCRLLSGPVNSQGKPAAPESRFSIHQPEYIPTEPDIIAAFGFRKLHDRCIGA